MAEVFPNLLALSLAQENFPFILKGNSAMGSCDSVYSTVQTSQQQEVPRLDHKTDPCSDPQEIIKSLRNQQ